MARTKDLGQSGLEVQNWPECEAIGDLVTRDETHKSTVEKTRTRGSTTRSVPAGIGVARIFILKKLGRRSWWK